MQEIPPDIQGHLESNDLQVDEAEDAFPDERYDGAAIDEALRKREKEQHGVDEREYYEGEDDNK